MDDEERNIQWLKILVGTLFGISLIVMAMLILTDLNTLIKLQTTYAF